MMLDRRSGAPFYVQLADTLRQRIRSGDLSVNEWLPSERELCEKYGVSRITVRRSLADLADENLIHTIPGKGSYVAAPEYEDNLCPFNSFTEDMSQHGLTAISRVLEARTMKASEEQAEKLKVLNGAELIVLRRLRSTVEDRRPIVIQTAWLPHHKVPGLLDYDLETRSLFEILRIEYRLTLARAVTEISARMPDADERRLLGIAGPTPVLVNRQTSFDPHGEIIEYTRSIYRGDVYTLYVDMKC
jgi:GntR family transcriptional regulator